MISGIDLIAAERQRQIDVEGFTIQHDLGHDPYALLDAGLAYANACIDVETAYGLWPFDPEEFKPRDELANLVRAGALIAAAIDRLQAG